MDELHLLNSNFGAVVPVPRVQGFTIKERVEIACEGVASAVLCETEVEASIVIILPQYLT